MSESARRNIFVESIFHGVALHPFPLPLTYSKTGKSRPRVGIKTTHLLPTLTFFVTVLGSYGAATGQVSIKTSVSTNQNIPSATVTSPGFSTSTANQLLLAFISTDDAETINTTVRSVTGAGLTWVLVDRTNQELGTSEIWRAFATARLSNVAVTATLSQTVVSSMTVLSFTGVPTIGTSGSRAIGAVASGYASSGAPKAKLTSTQNGSLVLGVGNDFDNAIARTPLAGQTVVHQDLSSTQDTYWVQRINSVISSKGTTVTLGDSAPTKDRYNLSICEVLPGTPTLGLSSSSLGFGTVADGTKATLPLTLKSTGTEPVTINSDSITGTDFSISSATLPKTLSPGQSITLQVSFHPSTARAASGTIKISSNSSSGSTSTVTLSGTGTAAPSPRLTLSANTLAFGNVTVNTSATKTLTLASSGTAPLKVNSVMLAGAGFAISGAAFPATLNPGQSVTLEARFDPTATGADTGTITISSNSSTGVTATVSLSGTGTNPSNPVLTVSTTALNFGDDPVGTTATLSVKLTSTGTSPVTVSAASVTGSDFTFSGATFPVTLNPAIAITIQVHFDPTAVGAVTGTLQFTGNSTTGTTSMVNLSGNGTAVTHKVSLSWSAPVNSPVHVTGYNVYRATGGSTSFLRLSSSDTQTSYVDLAVVATTTYTYYVTSVDSQGTQSGPSNEVTVTVP
jgi:hypothetical protein